MEAPSASAAESAQFVSKHPTREVNQYTGSIRVLYEGLLISESCFEKGIGGGGGDETSCTGTIKTIQDTRSGNKRQPNYMTSFNFGICKELEWHTKVTTLVMILLVDYNDSMKKC